MKNKITRLNISIKQRLLEELKIYKTETGESLSAICTKSFVKVLKKYKKHKKNA